MIVDHIIFVLEFKIGQYRFTRAALEQAWDYALDLKNFHEPSHNALIVPIVIATEAEPPTLDLAFTAHGDGVAVPVRAVPSSLQAVIIHALTSLTGETVNIDRWEHGRYLPTPTIIEAAQALYARHSVAAIARSDAGAANLAVTSMTIDAIIEHAKAGRKKVICFVTGVPDQARLLLVLILQVST